MTGRKRDENVENEQTERMFWRDNILETKTEGLNKKNIRQENDSGSFKQI
jgi:hypothetical protein